VRYTLTADELDLRSSLRSFLSALVPAGDYERICETDEGFDRDVWTRLASQGWLDLHAMSAETGGSAWPIAGVIMAEEYGRTLVPAPVELVAGFLLPLLGKLAPGSFGLDLEDAVFVDEVPAVCVDPLLPLVYRARPGRRAGLVIEEQDGRVRLTGELPAVQFAGVASSLFLPVVLSTGWALARVDLGADEVRVAAGGTVDPGRSTGSVTVTALEIPAADLVRHAADGSSLEGPLTEALLSYLLFLDGKAIGACEVMLERTVAYVRAREQFGVAIGSFQAVKHKVADIATAIESSRSLASFTAWQVAQRHADSAEAVLASRLHCADAYRRVCELAIQCHGGMGFTWEVGLHFWYRSATHDSAVADVTLGDLARVLGGAA
jgi:acyl-CoA dehydrogenase